MLDFSVTFIITIINITVLFFILRAILFKPVTKFMEERAKRVQDSIDQAESDRAAAKELIAQYEEKLKNTEAEAEEILNAAREAASKEAQQIITKGKADAAEFSARFRKQLEIERLAILAKFNTDAAALVIAASSKIVSRELDSAGSRRYAAMLIDELAMKKGKS
jgi:F-type H+-transporting ATPase subunit b